MQEKIVKLHKEGKTVKEIAKQLGTTTGNIYYHAKKINLKFQGSGGQNRIITENPFINSPESDYWIGYIAADGWLSTKKYAIGIVSKDIEHLFKFKKFLGKRVTEHLSNDKLTITFGSKITHSYLISKGITPRKSLNLKVNFKINRDFLRGIIDGDGCFSKTRRTQHKITSGSIEFLEQIKQFLQNNNIISKISIQQKVVNTTYCLRIYNYQSKQLYNLLYKDAIIFLERKEHILRHAAEMLYAKGVNSGDGEIPNPEPSLSSNI